MKSSIGWLSLNVAVILAAGSLYSNMAWSEEAANPPVPAIEKKKAGGEESHTANLEQALQLVEYARANESPTALVVAAQIVRRVELSDDPSRMGEKSTEGGGAGKSEGKKDKPPAQLDAAALLDEARGLAGDDSVVVALIDQEAAKTAAKTRGRKGGAACSRDQVPPGGVDYWPIQYRAGEYAQVVVLGDGDTDLDCYVFDQADDILVRDERYFKNCNVRWYTRYGGKFTVAVSNKAGRVYNNYRLCTD